MSLTTRLPPPGSRVRVTQQVPQRDQSWTNTVEGTLTAQAYITTDLDDNQITAFHPGAMDYAHDNR